MKLNYLLAERNSIFIIDVIHIIRQRDPRIEQKPFLSVKKASPFSTPIKNIF